MMKLNISFRSDTKLIGNIVSSVVSLCKIFSTNKEFINISTPLILDELLRNAISHGNNNDIKKKVKIELKIDSSYLKIVIIDEGAGFDYKKIMNNLINFSIENNSNHGRGILLVKKYSENLNYSLGGKKVTVMVKYEK